MPPKEKSFDAIAAMAQRSVDRIEVLTKRNERLQDLVRYKRHELHNDGLITNEEYAQLVQVPGAVERLEGYEKMRAENMRLREALVLLHAALHNYPSWQDVASRALDGR